MLEILSSRRAVQRRKSFAGGILSACLVLGALSGAQAASLSWDQNGGGTLGGDGTWDLTSTNWWDGSSDVAWSDTTGSSDLGIFDGTAGTVTIGTDLGALGLVFNAIGYTLSGPGTLTLGTGGIDASALTGGTTTIGAPVSLAAAQTWAVGTDASLSVSGGIGGTGALTKSGEGSLQFNSANTYSGGTTLNAGSLILSGTTASAGTGALTLAGGNLIKTGPANQALTTSNALNVTGTTIVSAQNTGNWTFSGAMTGSGTFNVSNALAPAATTIILSGDLSNFQGTLAQASGNNRLRLAAATTGNVTIDLSKATVSLSGSTTTGNPFDVADDTFGTVKIGALTGTGGMLRGGWVTGITTFQVGALNASSSFAGNIQDNVSNGGRVPVTALNKVGTGTLTLAGSNAYTGATTVNAGTLQIGDGTAGSISGNSAVSVSSGATLAFNQATGATSSNAIANEGTVRGVQGSGITNTLSGVISGTGGVNQNGAGTMNLSGVNTYSGATTVNAGTLGLTGAGEINATSGITVNGATASFLTASSTAVIPAVTVTLGRAGGSGGGTLGTVNVANNAGAGILTGAGGLNITSLTLDGAATFNWSASAPLAVDTFTINSSASSVTIGSSVAWVSSATPYTILSATSIGGTGAGLGAFALGDVTSQFTGLTPRQTATAAISGNTITLTIAGDNYPKWAGIESSAWNTTAANNWKLVNGGAATTFINGDQVLFDDSASTGTVAIDNGNVSVSGIAFDNSALNYTVSGANGITGTGALTKAGTGSVTLSTTNTYTGGTTINAGTVTATATGALGTGAVAIDGGTLNLNAASSVGTSGVTLGSGALNLGDATALNTGALNIAGGTLDNTSGAAITLSSPVNVSGNFTFVGTNDLSFGTNAIPLTADRTLTVSGGNLTIGGVISGGFGLSKAGAGTLILTAANTYSGGTVANGGTLQLGRNGNSDGVGAIRGVLTINNGATVQTTATDALGWKSGSEVTTMNINGGTFDNGASGNQGYRTNFVLAGGEVMSSGGGSINFTTGFGITTNASATTATWSAPIALRDGNNMPVSVADGTAAVDLEISGAITTTGGLAKSGAGTLLLSGVNTYTGATTINAGTLKVNGSLSAVGQVAVNTGGTLAGTGAVGDVTLASGGIVSPGDGGIGALSVSSLTWNDGTMAFDLNSSDNTSDQLFVSGFFSLGAGTTFTFDLAGGQAGQTYTLVSFGSTDFTDGSQFTANGVAGTFSLDAGSGTLTFTAVPEPGTVVLTMIGLGAILFGMRRRRHVA
jgi:autotransporter-associated beta strand protein